MEINKNLYLPHYSYPSIEQYRQLIRNVNEFTDFEGVDKNDKPIYKTKKKPILSFIGTPKKHGTNAAVVMDYDKDQMYFQSKEAIITPERDNAGFATFMANKQDSFRDALMLYYPCFNFDLENIVIVTYGEWCGGNIQKGVALNQLPKMFIIFDIRIINTETGQNTWLPIDMVKLLKLPELGIYNTYDYDQYSIDINFNYPELSQNTLIEITSEVEKECPIGRTFGVSGIGEGVVWKCITPGYEDSQFWMKVKGEKHASTKVKTLAPVDTEQIANIQEFVENTVTDNRCIQSLSKLKEANKPLDKTSLGDFLKWIYNDIVKEEVDTIVKNNLDVKKLGNPIGHKAKAWFFDNELKFDELI